MSNNLISLFSKDPSERSKKDIILIEQLITDLQYFETLQRQIKRKLFNTIIKGIAQSATLIQYSPGNFIWKEDDKQDKIMIILSGSIQELLPLSEQELKLKEDQLSAQYPTSAHLFQYHPNRISVFTYDSNMQIKGQIMENSRTQKSQFFEIAKRIMRQQTRGSLQPQKSFRTSYQIPQEYMNTLSQEINNCLNNVQLQNEYLFKYLTEGIVLKVVQGKILQNGVLLNSNLELKKQQNTLFTLTQCDILQMNLSDYLNLESYLKQQKIYRLETLIMNGLIGDEITQEDQNQILKFLMDRYTKLMFTHNNIVYNQFQKQQFVYIVKKGEFQISVLEEQQDTKHKRTQSEIQTTQKLKGQNELILARLGNGSLLGEESFGIGFHNYKCISLSSLSKVIAIKVSDLQILFPKFPQFRDILQQRQVIKQNWLFNRCKSQIKMEIYNSEKLERQSQKYVEDTLKKRETQIISKFSALKPKQQATIYDAKDFNGLIKKDTSKKNIFENDMLKKIQKIRLEKQNTKMIEEQIKTEREASRKLLIKRITQSSNQTIQTQRDQSITYCESDIIPKLMSLDKQQAAFLKHMMGKVKIKQLLTPQEIQKPSNIAQIFEQKLEIEDMNQIPVFIRSLACTRSKNSSKGRQQFTLSTKNNSLSRLRIGKRICSQMDPSTQKTSRLCDSQLVVQNGINQFPTIN